MKMEDEKNSIKPKIALKDRTIKEREYFFYLLLVAFVVLMAPHMVRFAHGNTELIGRQPYLHERIAESIIKSDGAINWGKFNDDLILGGRSIDPTPYHYALAFAGYLFNMRIASRALPFIFGMLTVTFFYFALKRLGIRSLNRLVMSLLLVLSPPFMYLFAVSTPVSMSVFLTVLGSYLYLSKSRYGSAASLFCFFLASFFSLFNMMLIILVIIIASIIDGQKREKLLFFILAILLIYLIKPISFYYQFEYQAISLRGMVSDLGAFSGFGIFGIILATIGLFYSWKYKERFYPLYFSIVLLAATAFVIGNEANVYSNFFLVIFASIGLLKIKEIEWRFLQLRDITLLIIVCGLLFSSVSYTMRLSNAMPDRAISESLAWLKGNSEQGNLVLSHYSNGYWIETTADRPVLTDSLFYSSHDFNKRYAASYNLFKGKDLEEARELLKEYNVSHIWIDRDMREGLVWEQDNEGLLFLLRNEETFKKIYSNNETEIFEVHGLY